MGCAASRSARAGTASGSPIPGWWSPLGRLRHAERGYRSPRAPAAPPEVGRAIDPVLGGIRGIRWPFRTSPTPARRPGSGHGSPGKSRPRKGRRGETGWRGRIRTFDLLIQSRAGTGALRGDPASTTSSRRRARPRTSAALRPAAPPPTITTSWCPALIWTTKHDASHHASVARRRAPGRPRDGRARRALRRARAARGSRPRSAPAARAGPPGDGSH